MPDERKDGEEHEDPRVVEALSRADAPMTPPVPGLDDFEERLSHLEKRAKGTQQVQEVKRQQLTQRMRQSDSDAKGLAKGMSIAYTIIGLPLLGVVIGWFLDRGTGSQRYTQIGVLVGAVLGIAMAFVLINRDQKPQ